MAQNRTTLVIEANTTSAEAGIRRMANEMGSMQRMAMEMQGTLRSLGGVLSGFGLSLGIQQVTQYMDAWMNLNARLKLVTNSFQEFKTAQQGVFDIAQQTRQGLKETADLYYKVADSTRSMGLSQQQVLQHTKAISQAIVISGSSAESAKAALVQYGQALASNRLGGDELRSVAEQAPRLFRLIRENIANMSGGFGMTQAQFKAVAAEGYITTEKMIDAVNRGSKSLESEFSKLPLTIGQAWTLLENQVLKFVGSQGESTGMFTAIANSVKLLSENIGNLVNTLGIGIVSFTAYKAAMLGVDFIAWVRGIAAINTAQVAEITLRATNTASLAVHTAAAVTDFEAQAALATGMTAKMAAFQLLNSATLVNTATTQANVAAQAELAVATRTGAGTIAFLRNAFASLTATMSVNPFVAVATAIVAIGAALYAYRDSLITMGDKTASVSAMVETAWLSIKNPIVDVFDSIGKAWDGLGKIVTGSEWFKELKITVQALADLVKNSAIGQLASKAGNAISNSVSGFVSDFMKQAETLDQIDKAKKEREQQLNQQEKEAFKFSNATDLISSMKDDAGKLSTAENYQKKIAEIYMKEIRAKQILNDEIAKLDAIKDATEIENRKKQIQEAQTLANQLIAVEQKKIDDLAKKGVEHGDKLAKEIKYKLSNMKSYQSDMMESLADKYSVPANLLKSLATVESSWNPNAISPVGARGLFQVMPFNFNHLGITEADLKNEKTMADKSVKFVKEIWNKAGNDLEKFWTLWNAGHLRLSKEGVFSMELQPPETRNAMPKIKEAYKQLGGEVSQLTELERAHKKELDDKQRLYENTAIGKYLTDMAQLNRLYGDDKSSVIYQENAQKIAAEFEKSTVNLSEYNKEQDKLTQLLSAIATPEQKFMASMQDYTTVFNEGKISLEQYTQALAHFQDQLNKPADKLQDKYASESTKGFENEIEHWQKLQREITLTDDEMARFDLTNRKTSDGLHSLFDDTQINQIMKMREEFQQMKFIDDLGLSTRKLASSFSSMFSQVLTQGKSFTDALRDMFKNMVSNISSKLMDFGLNNLFSGNFISGILGTIGGVATGLLSSIFKDTYIDNTNPATRSDTVLGSTSQSNSIDRIIATLNNIHDIEYPELKAIGDSFRGVDREMYHLRQNLARSTANYSNMSAIGIPTSPTGQGQSVNPLGSPVTIGANLIGSAALGATGALTSAGLYAGAALINAGATSIGIGISTAAATSATMAGSVGAAMGATGATATMVGGAILGLAGGLVLAGLQYGLGKLLGIGKVKYTQLGEGIVIEAGKLMQDGMATAIQGATWRKDLQTVTGWFSDTKTVIETYGQLSEEMNKSLNSVSLNLTKGIVGIVDYFNLWDALGYKLATQQLRPMLKVDFFKDGKRVDDVNAVLENQINAWLDRTAENVFGTLFGEYQKIGEGMMETAVRLTTEVAGVRGAYKKLGLDIGDANLGMVHFADTITQFYQSSAKADDGLKNFMQSMEEIYNFVTSKGQKSQDSVENTQAYLQSLGVKGIDIYNPEKLRETISAQEKELAASISASTKAVTEIDKYSVAVKDAFDPTPATKMAEYIGSLGVQYASDWQKVLGVSNFEDATWATVEKAGYKAMMETSTIPSWVKAREFLNEKENIRTTGTAALGGAYQSIEQQQAALDSAKAVQEAEVAKQATLSSNISALNTQVTTSEKLIELQDTYLKSAMTGQQQLAYDRKKTLDKEYKGFTDDLSKSDTFAPIINAMRDAGYNSTITAADIQTFVWSLEDAKKATDDTKKSIEKLFDLTHTAAQIAVDTLKRSIADATSSAQISALKNEFLATQTANYDKKLRDLKTSLSDISATDSQKALNSLKAGIDDIKASFVEITDAAGNVLNPLNGLIGLLVDSTVAQGLQSNITALKGFKTSISDWLTGVNTSKTGNAKSQLEAAQKAFDDKYNIITDTTGTYDNAKKSEAMSAITGSADTLITMYKNQGASGKWATDNIKSLMDKMSSLPDVASMNVLNLDAVKTSNGFLEKIEANTKALTLAQSTTQLSAINTNAQNTKTVSENLTGSDAIKPISLNIDTMAISNALSNSAMTSIMSDQLTTLQKIYGAMGTTGVNLKTAVSTVIPTTITDTTSAINDYIYTDSPTNPSNSGSSPKGIGIDNFYKLLSKRAEQPSKGGYVLNTFANGGITNEAAIFGEAGWEAAVPLPDGRTIPVTIKQAPAQQQDYSEIIAVLVDGFGEMVGQFQELKHAVTTEQRKTTAVTAKNGDKFIMSKQANTLK